MKFNSVFVALTCFSLFVSAAGCSSEAPDKPELGRVSGVVKMDGTPLSGVTVYFKPETGRQSMATTDAEGVYDAKYLVDEYGVKVGPCSAWVEWGPEASGPAIPPQYGTASQLKLDVKPGSNTFDIEMVSK